MENPALPERLVIFDGVCNLCESSVNFIARRDSDGRFFFTPAQSPLGADLLERFGIDAERLDTVVLVKNGRALTRSTAALAIASELDGPWKLLGAFSLVPRPLRDLLYRTVARYRYRWFGKKKQCMLPAQNIRERFLEEKPAAATKSNPENR